MPEPVALAITVACASLISGIVTLSKQITSFVNDVRASRKDMDAVSRELSSLTLCLETLHNDSSKINFPESLQQNLVGVLRNCDDVTKEMQDLLRKLSSNSLPRRMQWSLLDRDDMNKLRSRLEAHKSAIDITLDMISIFLLTSIKDDTQAIKDDTTSIKQDTSQIAGLVQEIGLLRLQILQLEDRGGNGGVLLDRFLIESTIYAESVVDTEDLEAIEYEPNPILAISEQDKGPDPEVTHTIKDLDEPRALFEIQPRQNTGQNSTLQIGEKLPVSPAQIPMSSSGGTLLSCYNPYPKESYESTTSSTGGSQQASWAAQNSLIQRNSAQLPTRGAHLQSSLVIPPARLPVEPLKVKPLPLSPQRKAKERRAPLELDYEAIEKASIARGMLSQSERRRFDKKLLFLLNGNQDSLRAVPGQNRYRHRKSGTLSEVKAVLDRGADPSAKTEDGRPALIVEIFHAHRIEVIRLLLSRGADVKAPDLFYGRVLPLMLRVCKTDELRLEIMKVLLEYGADANEQSGFYGDALQIAASTGELQMVELLVEYGADVNGQAPGNNSALQVASARHHSHVVRFLLEHGADLNASSRRYGSALRAANKYEGFRPSDKTATIKLLRDYGAREDLIADTIERLPGQPWPLGRYGMKR